MGLLDLMNSEQGMLGLSLLAAAAPQAGPRNTGAGLLQALGNVQQFRAAQDAKKEREQDRAMRQQQFQLQQQQMQQALAEQMRMAQQREADTTALRGQFGALPGPTMDGSQLRRGFDPAGMLQSGASPQAIQQAMQLDQVINPRARPDEFKEVSGNLLRITPQGQVQPAWTAPEKPKDLPSAVQEYMFATSQGYKGTFDEWKKSNARAGASQVNVDRAPQGYAWVAPGKLAPIPGGPADKLPEKQQSQVIGVQNLRDAITEYRNQLSTHSKFDVVKPSARAEMGTKYKNMMLQAKEAYNLGVLNGPDMEVLQSVITDPMSLNGVMTPKESLDKQAVELDRIMNKMAGTASQVRPRGGGSSEPAGALSVVRTGTHNGRRVQQMSDGSIRYAD